MGLEEKEIVYVSFYLCFELMLNAGRSIGEGGGVNSLYRHLQLAALLADHRGAAAEEGEARLQLLVVEAGAVVAEAACL